MDPTVAYNLALFLHVVGVLGLFAALTVEGIALRGIRGSLTGTRRGPGWACCVPCGSLDRYRFC
jgi:hypothetical protein